MNVILLDIEGTTTPIDFVYGTLFPYARKKLVTMTVAAFDHDDLARISRDFEIDTDTSKPSIAGSPVNYLLSLMDKDRKSPALKSIQGKIWEAGYLDGSLKGEVFSDVVPALKNWRTQGRQICIYSSGSVLAQKLLFAHSTAGDLTPFIDAYFDTEVGPKKEPDSYRRIASQLGVNCAEVLFISDSTAECDAAQKAGYLVRYSVRPGNRAEESAFESIHNFQEVTI